MAGDGGVEKDGVELGRVGRQREMSVVVVDSDFGFERVRVPSGVVLPPAPGSEWVALDLEEEVEGEIGEGGVEGGGKRQAHISPPTMWKFMLFVYVCVCSVVLPLSGTGVLQFLSAKLTVPVMLLILVPCLVLIIVLVEVPILQKLTNGWVFVRVCPGVRCEPLRTLEEGFCCFRAPESTHSHPNAPLHRAVSILGRRLGEVEAGLWGGEGVDGEIRVSWGVCGENVAELVKEWKSQPHSSIIVHSPTHATLIRTFSSGPSMAEWRQSRLNCKGDVETVQEHIVRVKKIVEEKSGEGGEREEGEGDGEEGYGVGKEENGDGEECGDSKTPSTPINVTLPLSPQSPPPPPALFKAAIVVMLALYPALVFLGFPAGGAAVEAGAHPLLGSMVTISTAVPLVVFIGAPTIQLAFKPWLLDQHSDECTCCGQGWNAFCTRGVNVCW